MDRRRASRGQFPRSRSISASSRASAPGHDFSAAMAALAADAERRIARADAAMKATGAPNPPNEKPAAMTENDYFRAA